MKIRIATAEEYADQGHARAGVSSHGSWRIAGVLAVAVLLNGGLLAAVWTGGGDGVTWNDAGNWENGEKPTNGSSVTISVTPSASTVMTNDIAGLSLAGLSFTNSNIPCDLYGEKITVTGTALFTWQNQTSFPPYTYLPVEVPEGSEIIVVSDGNKGLQWYAPVTGKGCFRKRGTMSITVASSNPDYEGDWHVEDGVLNVYGVPTAFGKGVINVYGQNKSAGTTQIGTLNIRRNITLENDIHLWYHSSVISYRGCTLNGDITSHTGNSGEESRIFPTTDGSYNGYFQINGSVRVDPEMREGGVSLYTDSTNQWIRFAGPEVDLAGTVFKWRYDGTFYFASPVKNTKSIADNTAALNLAYQRRVVFERENVFPDDAYFYCGTKTTNTFCTLDLNGYSQKIGHLGFFQPQATALAANPALTNVSVVTTSRGPASLVLTRYISTTMWGRFEGPLSLDFIAPNAGLPSIYFPEFLTNTLTGTITTRTFARFYMRSAFPALSRLEISNTGIMYFDKLFGVEEMNPEVMVDMHDLDTTSQDSGGLYTNGFISVGATDGNLKVRHVLYDDVDQPAGLYRRQKSGSTAGVTAPRWMQSGASYLTILNHDPLWVWTGGGDGISLLSAANWATNVSPADASDAVVLDFRHPAAAKLSLDGNLALAGLTGETNTAITVFGGSGTMTLNGSGTNSIAARFEDAVSVVFSGTGRQTFSTGKSTTAGRLSVQSGSVVFDSAFDWGTNGIVSVANGAKLELAEGVHAKSAGLKLGGRWAKKGIWGASSSSAANKSDIYFAGTGDIENLRGPGTLISLR